MFNCWFLCFHFYLQCCKGSYPVLVKMYSLWTPIVRCFLFLKLTCTMEKVLQLSMLWFFSHRMVNYTNYTIFFSWSSNPEQSELNYIPRKSKIFFPKFWWNIPLLELQDKKDIEDGKEELGLTWTKDNLDHHVLVISLANLHLKKNQYKPLKPLNPLPLTSNLLTREAHKPSEMHNK